MPLCSRQWIALGLSLAMGLAVVAVAAADEAPGGVESQPVGRGVEGQRVGGGGGSTLGAWLRTALALALVVTLVFATRWVLRRWGGGGRVPRDGEAVRVLARTRLTSRQELFLVRMGRRVLLLGGGAGNLSTLAEVTDPGEIDALTKPASRPEPCAAGEQAGPPEERPE